MGKCCARTWIIKCLIRLCDRSNMTGCLCHEQNVVHCEIPKSKKAIFQKGDRLTFFQRSFSWSGDLKKCVVKNQTHTQTSSNKIWTSTTQVRRLQRQPSNQDPKLHSLRQTAVNQKKANRGVNRMKRKEEGNDDDAIGDHRSDMKKAKHDERKEKGRSAKWIWSER